MQISINERHLEHIERKVQSGVYSSTDAVLAKALALLDEHDEALKEELHDVVLGVQAGIEAMADGDSREYTEETLHLLFHEVKNRGGDGPKPYNG